MARLRQKTLVGTVAIGRVGLGIFSMPRYDWGCNKESQPVQDEICTEVEEKVSKAKQGTWAR